MRIELLCNEPKYPDILACIFEGSEKRVDQICTPSGLVPRIDESFIREYCNFSGIVDFPYGISETRIRVHEILLCERRGIKTIDLVINRHDLESSNLFAIRKDFKTCYEACRVHNLHIRPVIEYRLAETVFIEELCFSLRENGASEIILGTGSMVDDMLDNIISSKLIEDKLGLSVISCSPILSNDHYNMFYESKIHGIRVKSYKILGNFVY
jgi:deoxyribose-phosphate aldolase|tara:strand:+ start:1368 stop:2003 length:636 start_codon:yes stop_codon:yes gene_type:complete